MSRGEDRVALVTGGGSGIGRATALALAEAGFHVVVTGRRLDALEETIGRAADAARLRAIPCDVTDEASVTALFDGVRDAHGRLDVLFNNAGTNVPPPRSTRSRSRTGGRSST